MYVAASQRSLRKNKQTNKHTTTEVSWRVTLESWGLLPSSNFDFSPCGSPSIIPDRVQDWIGNRAAYDGVHAASKLGVS